MFSSTDSILDMDEEARSPGFMRLMASVGLLMFHWSRLDEALVADIRRLRAEGGSVQSSIVRVRGSFTERLAEWRALLSLKSRRNPGLAEAVLDLSNALERLRQKRNLVAQSFSGASLAGEPHILCSVAGAGAVSEAARLTQSELNSLIDEMDRCAIRIRQIGAALQ